MTYAVASLQNTMQTIGLMNAVSFQAQWRGRSLEADVRARRIGGTALPAEDDRGALAAGRVHLSDGARPRRSLATAATGGTVAAGTYWVKVTAKNAQGETTASTGDEDRHHRRDLDGHGHVFTVPNATQYNVYIGSGGSLPADSAMWLQAGISGANAQQPAIGANGHAGRWRDDDAIRRGAARYSAADVIRAARDLRHGALDRRGEHRQDVRGWLRQAADVGRHHRAGAQQYQPGERRRRWARRWRSPPTATGKLALADIDNLLAGMYLQAAGDPDYIIMNPLDNVRLTNLVVGAGQLRYVVQSGDGATQAQLTAQYRVTRYLNKSTGKRDADHPGPLLPAGDAWSSCRSRCPSRRRRWIRG